MRVTKLSIKNVGILADTVIPLDRPLILFYGDIRQGKSTILKAVQWLLGAPWPTDLIRHGEKEASVELEFDGGLISRSWYIAKDKTTKARDLVFILNGRHVNRPAAEIQRLLNPFHLNQNHLVNMGEADRKKFFVGLFAVNTSALDMEWVRNDQKARELRGAISAYGDIAPVEVKPVDLQPLQAQLAKLRFDHGTAMGAWNDQCKVIAKEHQLACTAVDEQNRTAIKRNSERDSATQQIADLNQSIANFKAQIERCEQKKDAVRKWLADSPSLTEVPKPESPALPPEPRGPNLAPLEQAIQDAGATNARAEQYAKDKARADEKAAKEQELATLEARQKAIRVEKLKKLSALSESCPVKGLTFEEDGSFTYDGTQAGMLSTSQLMQLSSELSALYPEGLGIELLDRAESLGSSIFNYVNRAQAEQKTILATIVGEKPAKVPEHIGVFVVEEGHVKAAPQEDLKLQG